MSRIIIDTTIHIRGKRDFKLEVDGNEVPHIPKKRNMEIESIETEIEHGEYAVRIYCCGFLSTVKKRINVDKNEIRLKMTHNYKFWIGLILSYMLAAFLVLKLRWNVMFTMTPIMFIGFICRFRFGYDLKEIK